MSDAYRRRESNDRCADMTDIVRTAAKEGVAEALSEQRKKQIHNGDLMRKRVKLLLKNYKLLRASHADKVYDLTTLDEHPEAKFDEIDDLMRNIISKRDVQLRGVEEARARTHLSIANLETTLNAYRIICENSELETERRRWRVLEARYLNETPRSTRSIARDEYIAKRTVQSDIQAAIDDLCIMLRGIDGLKDILE